MENVPFYIALAFGIITALTVFIFYRATSNSKVVLFIITAWLLVQAIIAKSGFYANTTSAPPRFALALFPPLLVIILLFALPAGRHFIDSLNIKTLTILHIIRIPVEIALLALFIHKAIPAVMTFEGRNLDILSGLTAPGMYYLVFVKKWIGNKLLLVWNFICLGLLFNIVIIAILSAPFSFQHFGFDQPNIAILHFPFVWLPCCIVPMALFAHLVVIRQLLQHKSVNSRLSILQPQA